MYNRLHLRRLEAESIYIFREVIANFNNPVLMYSIGKDSSVLLHLARKAYYPSPVRMPLLHIDTGWKFKEMITFRDQVAHDLDLRLIVHTNRDGQKRGINPFDHGAYYTNAMKTQALKQAIDKYDFDAAIGGARRDEEKSRAKERIFSFRNSDHVWDPTRQRPEIWHTFNTRLNSNETVRVFPLSNWTENDIWNYIRSEEIPLVPLYYAKQRPVVTRDNEVIMIDDDRLPLQTNEVPVMTSVRFRTLGCYPLTGAIRSSAATIDDIIAENSEMKLSERMGRMIDKDNLSSLEQKKAEGYF